MLSKYYCSWGLPRMVTGEYPIQGIAYHKDVDSYINEETFNLLDKKDKGKYKKLYTSDPYLNMTSEDASEFEQIFIDYNNKVINDKQAAEKHKSKLKEIKNRDTFRFDNDRITNKKIQDILRDILDSHNLVFGEDCFNLYKTVGNMMEKLPRNFTMKNTLYLLSENYNSDTDKLM